MAAFLKLKSSFPRLKPLLLLHQRLCHTFLEGVSEAELFAELGPQLMAASGDAPDTSKWKKLDARSLGITSSMIPYPSRTVVRLLQNEGYDAFLVGGCVRDLLLNKIPKDFDVITTANLQQIKKKFYRAYIVGRRFPICMVHVGGSEIEVSSFETAASHGKVKEVHLSEMPKGYNEKDVVRWKNSLYRDFTVNSLFYDPFAHKVYDYSNGMTDLRAMKLRTLVPAQSSFQVDCARILRGLRIAARLGFSFAKDTEKAIRNLYTSVKTLNKARLMMEMNYMLSYGASQSSILLLKKFNLLEILLPFHAAYLAEQSDGQTPVMLMELFSNLDIIVSCDRPCDTALWVSLLVFHLALVNNPQDALVVWTLSSLLCHGTWKEGVKAAREHSEEHINFAPEIINFSDDVADEELAQKVSEFASIVLDSIDALTDSTNLREVMHCYPSSPCADVFISKNAGKAVAEIFHVLVDDIKSLDEKRHCSGTGIDYELLGKGDIAETRFVLGKVIMGTMKGGTTQCRTKLFSEKKDKFHATKLKVEQTGPAKPNSKKDVKQETKSQKGKKKRGSDGHEGQLQLKTAKKQKLVKEKLGEILSSQGIAKREHQLKKVVVKDVKKLLSLYKETPRQDTTKLEIRACSEASTPKETPTILKKLPTTVKPQETPGPNQILYVLENAPKMGKQHDDAQDPEEMLISAAKVLKPHKAQAPIEILKVLKNSTHSKADEGPSKKCSQSEKQLTVEEQDGDASKTIKKPRKLSSFFK